jgi:hypothetical protein
MPPTRRKRTPGVNAPNLRRAEVEFLRPSKAKPANKRSEMKRKPEECFERDTGESSSPKTALPTG